jgi:hypothetical protein
LLHWVLNTENMAVNLLIKIISVIF